jgi:hypothetical protein
MLKSYGMIIVHSWFIQRGLYYTLENKCEQLLAESRKFHFTRFAKHDAVACEKHRRCLQSQGRSCLCIAVYCLYNQLGLFYSASVCTSVNFQLNCHPAISSSRILHPSASNKLQVTHCLSLAYAVIAVTCRILLFMILPLDSSIDLKLKNVKSDTETKNSCKVTTLDEKIRILDQLRGSTWLDIP